VTKYDWLLLFHVLGAFLIVAGSIVAAILQLAAVRRTRPSEVLLLLGLIRPAVVAIGIGAILTLGLGLWLADDAGYGIGEGWVVAAIALWVVAQALGGLGGKPLGRAAALAQRLAEDGDQPSAELHRAVADRRAFVLSYLSFAAVMAILVLMVFKPGAG
jgi:uncharacterized membrane protein